MEDGFLLLDSIDPLEVAAELPASWSPLVRANDGKVDASGALWLGTMDRAEAEPIGALYRFGPDLAGAARVNGVTISNGLDWSTDGRKFFYIDTPTRQIVVYDFDLDAGVVSSPRVFARFDGAGVPDGLCVDVEDGVWVALWGGGCVRRYDSGGEVTAELALPCPYVTSCVFGGPELDTLFITTAQGSKAVGLAGGLFAVTPGIRGRVAHRFRTAAALTRAIDAGAGA